MKTSKIIVVLMSIALLLVAGNAFAAITGGCVDCHTMHNSQNGNAMTFDAAAGPQKMLLKAGSCGGCHADATAAASGAGIPQVNSATLTFAGGGSFYWVAGASGDDTKGHNVVDLADADAILSSATNTSGSLPPGYTGTSSEGVNNNAATWALNTQLTCAGVNGCHGDPQASATGGVAADNEFDSIKGAHHTNAGNDGATVLGLPDPVTAAPAGVGGSFRFLDQIKGVELNDAAPFGDANHNVYFGAVGDTDKTTISALCARCHGNFHLRAEIGGTSSPWVRHPTDIDMNDLASTSEYAAYTFTTEAPVAANTIDTAGLSTGAVNYAENIVTCLSCHFAHGSDQADLLRWDYSAMTAGAGVTTGCMNCHTTK